MCVARNLWQLVFWLSGSLLNIRKSLFVLYCCFWLSAYLHSENTRYRLRIIDLFCSWRGNLLCTWGYVCLQTFQIRGTMIIPRLDRLPISPSNPASTLTPSVSLPVHICSQSLSLSVCQSLCLWIVFHVALSRTGFLLKAVNYPTH